MEWEKTPSSEERRIQGFIEHSATDIRNLVLSGFDEINKNLTTISHKVDAGFPTARHQAVEVRGNMVSSASTSTFAHRMVERVWPETPRSLTTSNPAEEIERQNQLLSAVRERDSALSERDSAISERDNQHRRIQALEKQAQKKESEMQQLRAQSTKFRQIILESGKEDGEPLDEKVVNDFRRLRDTVQRIVTNYYQVSADRARLDTKNGCLDSQKAFFEGWSVTPEATRRLRLRSKIFRIMYNDLLEGKYFGLGDTQDKELASFELLLETSCEDLPDDTVRAVEVAEWRQRTVAFASRFDHSNQRSKELSKAIRVFFEPVLKKAPSSATEAKALDNKYRQALDDLCQKTVEFSLMLRKSKSTFEVKRIKPCTRVDDSDGSDMLATDCDGPQPEKVHGSDVAFTLFGALIKKPTFNSKERYVLEKAHVVCRA